VVMSKTENILYKVATGTLGAGAFSFSLLLFVKGYWLLGLFLGLIAIWCFLEFTNSFRQDIIREVERSQYDRRVQIQKNRKNMRVIK